MTIFRVGKQQPRQKGTQCHRQPCLRRQRCRRQHQKQCGRHEQFAAAAAGDKGIVVLGNTSIDADQEDGSDDEHRFGNCPDGGQGQRAFHAGSRKADKQQDWHNRQILKQQNGETAAPRRRVETTVFGQKLANQGGG